MEFVFKAKISSEGFPLAHLEIRKNGATTNDVGYPTWAIIDTASASSYIRPETILKFPDIEKAKAPSIPFATGIGGGEAEGRYVSLWAKGEGHDETIKLLDQFNIGVHKVLVQPVLIGKNLLDRGELSINWATKEVRLVLSF
jgi:hypothetical protein